MTLSLEEKILKLHTKMNSHKQIKGSLLVKDDGIHISSNIPKSLERRKLSAHIATIFRYICKKNQQNEDEVKISLENGVNLYMKYIPSKKIILTSLTDNASSPRLKMLMNYYSKEFQDVFF